MDTIDETDPVRTKSAARREGGAELLRVLDCENPFAEPLRVELRKSEVLIKRADAEGVRTEENSLVVGIRDRWMSDPHARMHRVLNAWMLEDLDSRNGTAIDGRPLTSGELQDGDWIELGHNLFLFREQGGAAESEGAFAGATFSPGLRAELSKLQLLAPADLPLLILGETGTGKEVLANRIHRASKRTGQLVAVNCAALPATLVESELFGFRRGTFSGAEESRQGLVRAAQKGTLFLDEIGDLPLAAQASLLRFLQSGEVAPLGEAAPVKVDVRVIAATNQDLEAMVRDGRFRADLYSRLRGYEVRMPPLRERKEDLGLLIAAILKKQPEPAQLTFSREAARALAQHDWPMNVRELEQALLAAVLLAGKEPIDLAHLPASITAAVKADGIEQPALRAELQKLLEQHKGNITAVAREMGKARMQIHRWMSRFGLRPESFRK